MHRIQAVEPLADHRLYLCFEDGRAGTLDLGADIEAGGIFGALRQPSAFAAASLE